MNNRYLLDSWAFMALFSAEQPASKRVEHLLLGAADGNVVLFFSIINLGEIFYLVGRREGIDLAENLTTKIKQLPIQIVPVDEQRVIAAARYKMTHSISYADAFALAAAAEFDAVLATGDPELWALADVVEVERL
ncbi:MAG: PIN domain-containing protein [Candidatus Promineifilaceae bacterium]|nr:PIN domain-containing protein [Candidatus Promineifilaceae bacterium]